MSTPNEIVVEAFAQAQSYASDAKSQLTLFTNQLNAAIQVAPLVDVTFTPITDPGADTIADYSPPADYTDSILTTLASVLSSRLAGGTGLAPDVEAAIWDRARGRELALAQANIDDVTVQSEALGFELPPGVLNEGIRRATNDYYDKASGLSRDIAVKQADLEQANMQQSIEKALGYETTFADILAKRSQVALDAFRADVMRFQAQVEQDVKHWEVQIRQYQAQQEFILNASRLNTEIARANLATVLEAAKTGAQVYAQLVAAAYSLIHASAGVSASASDSVSYGYSGDAGTVSPVTAV